VSNKLKPCPSCGAKNTPDRTLITELYDHDKYKYGKCFNCGAKMYNCNTRPIEDALQARIAELEKLLSGNPQTMTTQEMLAMPLNSEIALCNGCYIMRVPGGWIYKDTYNYSDSCGVSAMGVFVPEPSDIACDAHLEKSATQAPLPVSGATQQEVDNEG
jgi:hypothetical protein